MTKTKNAFKSTRSLTAAICAALALGAAVSTDAAQGATKFASLAAPRSAVQPRTVSTVALFFDVQSDALTPEAQAVLRDVVRVAEHTQASRIELAAYSAPAEMKRDRFLPSRRAAAVSAYIEQLGFEGDIVAVGGPDPKLPTIGLDDTLNRRVVLNFTG